MMPRKKTPKISDKKPAEYLSKPWMTVIPAYGRDYPNAEAVLKDWIAKKDFQICDVSYAASGAYIGRGEAERDNNLDGTVYKVRYNRLRDFCLIFRKDGSGWP